MIVLEPEMIAAGDGGPKVALLADASATGGAASVQRVDLPAGVDGASPHYHTRSAEVFHVLHGALEMLIGDDVVEVPAGALVVIEPNTVHAFAAPPSSAASALIVLTPGVDRFGYFRLLRDVASGERAPSELLAAQDEYDNHFVDSPPWRARRDAGAAHGG
ncbi:cupin domain-containing protein [Tsukamurella paurometabola]|uniref:Cupin domain-containing protein n=1 Tax=Tsukamurella paurometabola TaxID=2061 RepID=A0A3P8KV01_TSUPA|nr:cupin domain-containing protein [Tsukamurella paurometabola]MBS4099812.1 cupin domain-containing protein [Tsukamurella paurometabola]UEA83811.1 cupin domain-containing protein [Tsukamurella paurometabola]VDR40957.1 Uncharacterized conserved protein, contains double-stranded beta-helix domain [Tsukamurella paurometabola]